jgi:hypothetical protein
MKFWSYWIRRNEMNKLFVSSKLIFLWLLLLSLVGSTQASAQEKIPTIYFENFPVPVIQAGVAAQKPLDFKSNPGAWTFRSRIREAYKQDMPNFAGHFKVAVFGCGASCLMGFAMDMITGKIYNLPLGEENSCMFAAASALFKAESNLFVSKVCKENADSTTLYYTAFVWKQDPKHPNNWKFEPVKSKEFLAKKSRVPTNRKRLNKE